MLSRSQQVFASAYKAERSSSERSSSWTEQQLAIANEAADLLTGSCKVEKILVSQEEDLFSVR